HPDHLAHAAEVPAAEDVDEHRDRQPDPDDPEEEDQERPEDLAITESCQHRKPPCVYLPGRVAPWSGQGEGRPSCSVARSTPGRSASPSRRGTRLHGSSRSRSTVAETPRGEESSWVATVSSCDRRITVVTGNELGGC